MPHWFVHGATVSGRVFAGLVGALAFYMAFFMYEDQEGRWQNRLEILWMSVYDRAKNASETATALLNTTGQVLVHSFDVIFGDRLFSPKLIVASAYLSAGGAFIGSALSRFQQPDRHVAVSCLLIGGLLLGVGLTVNRLSKNYIVLVGCGLPLAAFAGLSLYLPYATLSLIVLAVLLPVLLAAVVCDFIAVIFLRWVLLTVSNTQSLTGIAGIIVIMTGLAVTILMLPLASNYDNSFAGILGMLNLTTAFYCLLPDMFLLIMLSHIVVWPVLSRLIYSMCRFEIITNKKKLASIGALSWTLAFNLGHVGLKELLKLT